MDYLCMPGGHFWERDSENAVWAQFAGYSGWYQDASLRDSLPRESRDWRRNFPRWCSRVPTLKRKSLLYLDLQDF
jgi:hypothetical protein